MKDFPNVEKLKFEPAKCLVCLRPITSFYGRWGRSGTCSRTCDEVYRVMRNNDRREDKEA